MKGRGKEVMSEENGVSKDCEVGKTASPTGEEEGLHQESWGSVVVNSESSGAK